jgi:hypothetical protein
MEIGRPASVSRRLMALIDRVKIGCAYVLSPK